MRITSLEIKNYRSFDEIGASINFPKMRKPISVIGYNSAGKSNLVQGIRHATCDINSFDGSFKSSDFYKQKDSTFSIKLTFDPAPVSDPGAFGQFKEMPIIKLEVKKDNNLVVDRKHNFYDKDEKTIYIPQATKISSSRLKTLTEDQKDAVQALFKSGSQSVYRNKDKINFHYISFPEVANEFISNRDSLLGKKMYELVRTFESSDNVMKHNDKNKGRPRKDVYKICIDYLNEHVLTSPEIESFVDEFKSLLAMQLDLSENALIAEFQNPDYLRVLRAIKFKVSDFEDTPELPIEQLGSGFGALVAVTLLQILLSFEEGGKVIVVEEPETFLHEHYQLFFYKVLQSLSKNNQVIIVTHSRNFIDLFSPETIIRLSKKSSGATDVRYATTELELPEINKDYPLKTVEDFGKYLRTVEPSINSILFAKKVVIVEGPHDVLVYKSIFEEKAKLEIRNISIVAAWGKVPIIILGKICEFFGIDSFAVHDKDLSFTDKKILKAQATINTNISKLFGSNLHVNEQNLEDVLGIPKNEKSAGSAYLKVQKLSYQDVKKTYPKLISNELEKFMEISSGTA